MSSYLTTSDADALAATLPAATVAAYLAAANDATKEAALLMATADIDGAFRYQGRKYDLETPQELEFPRVAYETGSNRSSLDGVGPVTGRGSIADTVWDWDSDANAATVPPAVLMAVARASSTETRFPSSASRRRPE